MSGWKWQLYAPLGITQVSKDFGIVFGDIFKVHFLPQGVRFMQYFGNKRHFIIGCVLMKLHLHFRK